MADVARTACDLFSLDGVCVETIEVRNGVPAVIVTPNGCYLFNGWQAAPPYGGHALYRAAVHYQHGGQFLAWEYERAGYLTESGAAAYTHENTPPAEKT